jgi:hypothetical protein
LRRHDVIAICVALVLVGVAIVIRWGALPDQPGNPPEAPRSKAPIRPWRNALRVAAVGVVSGLAASVLAAGAGGRLVMRLLAVTSPDARGRITDAGEVVDSISAAGTLGLIVFAAIVFGWTSGLLYMMVRRFLPAGRARGVAFGALLLVFASTRVDPLLADNPDFVIVGPAWLAVLAFSATVLFHGMLVAALAERISIALPSNVGQPAAAPRHTRTVTGGRAVLGVAVVVALPGFVAAIADIL